MRMVSQEGIVREILSILCHYKNVEIVAGAICDDHVHFKCSDSTQNQCIIFYGIFEREEHVNCYMIGIPIYKASGIRHSGQEDIT